MGCGVCDNGTVVCLFSGIADTLSLPVAESRGHRRLPSSRHTVCCGRPCVLHGSVHDCSLGCVALKTVLGLPPAAQTWPGGTLPSFQSHPRL